MRTICWGGWESRRSRASCALRMLCNLLLVLTQVLTSFNGSMWYVIRGYEGGVQSPCLVLEPAHGGGNGSRSPPPTPSTLVWLDRVFSYIRSVFQKKKKHEPLAESESESRTIPPPTSCSTTAAVTDPAGCDVLSDSLPPTSVR